MNQFWPKSIKLTPGLNQLRDKVAEVVAVTHQSSSAKDRFEASQRQIGCQGVLKLKQHVPHRWNSLYEMFERFVELKSAIFLFLFEEEKRPEFSSEDWLTMKGLVAVLKPPYDVTTELCGEKHTTVSKVIPLTEILKAFYGSKDQSSEKATDLQKRLLTSITSRFELVESAHILALATLLDPRYKANGFERPNKIARAVQMLKEEAEFQHRRSQEDSTHQAESGELGLDSKV